MGVGRATEAEGMTRGPSIGFRGGWGARRERREVEGEEEKQERRKRVLVREVLFGKTGCGISRC